MYLAPRVLLTACFAALASTCLANTPRDRRISVVTQCTFPVWPALFTSVGPRPSHETGWKAAPGSSVTFTVKEGWGGRIWGRTGCDFSDSSKPDYEQCETGGCVGGLRCDPDRGTGVPPVTLAEFNLQSAVDNCESRASHDTSLVDGNNLAIALTNSADCPLSNCPYNLPKVCPEELQKKNVEGEVVGCLTACSKWGNEEYCCSGAHSTPETCPASGVKYYDFWKRAAPLAYAFAYDEASGTALFTCTKQADWTITFCPDASLFATTALLPNGTTITQGKGLEPFPTYSPKKVRRVSARGHNKAEVAAGSGH